jgi:hypothetical protein
MGPFPGRSAPARSTQSRELHFQLRPRWAVDLSEKDMISELSDRKEEDEAVYAA